MSRKNSSPYDKRKGRPMLSAHKCLRNLVAGGGFKPLSGIDNTYLIESTNEQNEGNEGNEVLTVQIQYKWSAKFNCLPPSRSGLATPANSQTHRMQRIASCGEG
jgi:hypothetical protein